MKELDMKENNGSLYLQNERVVVTSTNVFGELRNDLSKNIGQDRVKTFLLRYGWNLGRNDAKKSITTNQSNLIEMLKKGPVLHELKGYTKVQNTKFDIQFNDNGLIDWVHVEGIWFNSYEAEENLQQHGVEKTPVCYTLIGYASGYYSTICKKDVIFKETSCKGKGNSVCTYVGKTLNLWDGEADDELASYHNQTIIQELDIAYNDLLRERNNLTRALKINEKLTKNLMDEKDLNAIARTVYTSTNNPFIIINNNFKTIAFDGIDSLELSTIEQQLEKYVEKKNKTLTNSTIASTYSFEKHIFLMVPILLQNELFGYCLFIYTNNEQKIPEIDSMILDRVATVCSIYLLHEKNNFETMERMKGTFLEQLINKQITLKSDILKRTNYIQLNLNKPYYIFVIQYNSLDPAANDLLLFEQLMETIFQYFKNSEEEVLVGHHDGYITLLIQQDIIRASQDRHKFGGNLLNSIKKLNKSLTFKMGVSSLGNDITKVPYHYEEAVVSLKVGNISEHLTVFDDIGITGILINSSDKTAIIQKATHLLRPFYELGEMKNKDYLQTLYVFLQHGGNLDKSMKDLSLSLSGLRYRINKIETILNVNLREPQEAHEILLALKSLLAMDEIHF